jgi:serine/threonine protein kinase
MCASRHALLHLCCRYNEKADIWSVGITALELLKGYAPYSSYAPMQVLLKTIREPPPSIKSYVDAPGAATVPVSDRFNKFVARCLQRDPRARSSAHDLLEDPFIKRSLRPEKLAELLRDVPDVGSVKDSAAGGGREEARPGEGKIDLIAAAGGFDGSLRARGVAASTDMSETGSDDHISPLPLQRSLHLAQRGCSPLRAAVAAWAPLAASVEPLSLTS